MQHEEIGTKEDFAKYRLDTAKTDLKSAKLLSINHPFHRHN